MARLAAITRAIAFLETQQLPHGELRTYRYDTPTLDPPGHLDTAPFDSTFVLHALALTGEPSVAPMVERGIRFILSELEGPGLWRFRTARGGAQVDPDLDDTCCCSFILKMLAPEKLPANQDLILQQRTPEGLFKTWVRPPHAPNDVDSVVNANVILYLGERDETRAACGALCRLINGGHEESSLMFYLDPFALYYAVSRAYRHGAAALAGCRDTVIGKVLARQQPDGSFGNELLTGLALCTLANYGSTDGEGHRRGLESLLQTQQQDGSWRRHAFYAPPPEVRRVWWGSEALTTAICLEALARRGAMVAG